MLTDAINPNAKCTLCECLASDCQELHLQQTVEELISDHAEILFDLITRTPLRDEAAELEDDLPLTAKKFALYVHEHVNWSLREANDWKAFHFSIASKIEVAWLNGDDEVYITLPRQLLRMDFRQMRQYDELTGKSALLLRVVWTDHSPQPVYECKSCSASSEGTNWLCPACVLVCHCHDTDTATEAEIQFTGTKKYTCHCSQNGRCCCGELCQQSHYPSAIGIGAPLQQTETPPPLHALLSTSPTSSSAVYPDWVLTNAWQDSPRSLECPICFDDFKVDQLFILNCGMEAGQTESHKLCPDCLTKHLRSKLVDDNPTLPYCPAAGCRHVIADEEIAQLFRLSHISEAEKILFSRKLQDVYLKMGLNSVDNLHECPHCETKFALATAERHCVTCPRCHNRSCSACKNSYHIKSSCAETLELRKQQIMRRTKNEQERKRKLQEIENEKATLLCIRNNCRPCPKCHTPIEKGPDCLHMTCTRCRHMFCWTCLKAYTRTRERGLTHEDFKCEPVNVEQLIAEGLEQYFSGLNNADAPQQANDANVVHAGSQCQACKKAPITGTLYKCIHCIDVHYDLCGECEGDVAKHGHDATHIFIPISKAEDAISGFMAPDRIQVAEQLLTADLARLRMELTEIESESD
eukprot:TRINITY_DN61689_c0_g1_i2.p1 TRINITY_DN61689_c0_g1~~TRINITY_DN61689_c0_g1_i2.p1  ORF type:complete len:638 (+),score=13.40 TRINITY_DN61689_c0_g1_i2:55-1968(+)